MTLEAGVGGRWFTNRVRRKVGDGRDTRFWIDRWIGEVPLFNLFPRLYSLSNCKEAMVTDVVEFHEGGRLWNVRWRRQPFMWETDLIGNLMDLLEEVVLNGDRDMWVWTPDEDGLFSVKSSNAILEKIFLVEEDVGALEKGVFSLLWKSPAPSKVVAFSWSLLLNRIPTRDNLAIRHILELDASLLFVLCGRREETSTHLFLHCEYSSLIWHGILNWLEIYFITPHNLFVHFECWNGEVISKRLKGFWLIWHVTIWLIWKERNARIFTDQRKDGEEVVDEIKVVSWVWTLSRLKIASFLFYEWTWNPRECLNRRWTALSFWFCFGSLLLRLLQLSCRCCIVGTVSREGFVYLNFLVCWLLFCHFAVTVFIFLHIPCCCPFG